MWKNGYERPFKGKGGDWKENFHSVCLVVVESAACVFLNHIWLSDALNLQLVIILLESVSDFDHGIRLEMGEYVLNQII